MKQIRCSKTVRRSAALILTLLFCRTAAFASHAAEVLEDPDYRLTLDGEVYTGETRMAEDTAYLALREFACTVDNAVVEWDNERETATVTTEALTLTAHEGDQWIDANGRILWCEEGVFTVDDHLYIPVQAAAQAFGFDADYDADTHTTALTRLRGAILSSEDYYDADDLYWLAKIIHAEAGGEPFEGKLAVGTVIQNRVLSEEFPDTIPDVIFDRACGVQFTPTVNGAIEADADEDSILAAKLTLEHVVLSDEVLYFLNAAIATSHWIPQNCRFVMRIGSHDFYA